VGQWPEEEEEHEGAIDVVRSLFVSLSLKVSVRIGVTEERIMLNVRL
jgi:hypothetical protein